MPTSSLRRNSTAGLTVKVIPRKGAPESEAVTAALVARSLRLLRDIDPVFDVDLYQTVGDALPDGAGVEQALASNIRQILVPPTEKSIEAALIERRRSPDATGGMYPISLGRHMTLYSPAGDVKVVVSFGGTSGSGAFACAFADESLISLASKLVQGLADIWDSRVTVLYRRTESSPQFNVPGDAIVGSCTYFGPELPIEETQLPPSVEAFPYQDGTIVIQKNLSTPLTVEDIRSIRAAAGLPTERPEIPLPKGFRRL